MLLSKQDREFRLPKISYVDFKHLDMDRVLTIFFMRLKHNGFLSRLQRKHELTVEAFVETFLEQPEWFVGFANHREILTRWVETDLMDLVNRGRANQALAAPRPLHGYTYRFRNTKHARDYNAAQQIYEMLYSARHARGAAALDQLHHFFFLGVDKLTSQINFGADVLDVETQAILRLPHDSVGDAADTRPTAREIFPPLCVGSADLLAEDLLRLLFYEKFISRTVMIDYIKILFAFHLALYHLRLFKLLPALVRQQNGDPICAACPMNARHAADPHGDCPHRIGLLIDVAGQPDTPMARLAERSTDSHFRRIPTFVKAYFTVRKLDEFASDLLKRGKLSKPATGAFTVSELLALLRPAYKNEREIYFGQRLYRLQEAQNAAGEGEAPPEIAAIMAMGLDNFETYIEILVALRGNFHRRYLVDCLDSMLMKNDPGALITQARTRNAQRRFTLDSRLLEVLLQIAVLQPGGALGYYTGELRIDDLLTFLRERYGLYIDRLPAGDGFGPPSIEDRKALRANTEAFTARLREVGFYRDLSDAYVTQTVTPRYQIDKEGQSPGDPANHRPPDATGGTLETARYNRFQGGQR